MSKIYLNLSHMEETAKAIASLCPLADTMASADIIVTEDPLDFINNKLIITLNEKDPKDGSLFINSALPIQAVAEAVKAAAGAARILSLEKRSQPVYHVLRNGDPRVEYFINRLENILNAAPESIVEIDSSGNIFFHNTKFSSIYDPASSIIEANIFDIFDGETSEKIKKSMAEVVRSQNVEFTGKMTKKNGVTINIAGHVTALPDDNFHYEITFDDVTSKLAKLLKIKKIEEQSIVAGFSRHLSHNVMNALTAAGGFIRQIKAKSVQDSHTQNLWRIIDEKLSLIEEIVAGYNDYTHAVSFIAGETVELASFYEELIRQIADKNIDRNFSAYLCKFASNYNITYDFSKAAPFPARGNRMFLKLALCYILKDNIRYFGTGSPLEYSISLATEKDSFNIYIRIPNIDVADPILETMFSPWNHQMLSQSFDYWGIVIAGTILEKHNGKASVQKSEGGLLFTLTFYKQDEGESPVVPPNVS